MKYISIFLFSMALFCFTACEQGGESTVDEDETVISEDTVSTETEYEVERTVVESDTMTETETIETETEDEDLEDDAEIDE